MNEFDRSLAVIVGINDYQNGIDKLNTAVPDAVAIAKILQNTYNYELIHPDGDSEAIVDNCATKAKLQTLLTDILPNKIKPTKSDRLIFYFAGHGIARNSDDEPQGFLVPQDADMKQQDSLLRMSDVHDWLAELECKHLLVILDCCFAGAFRWASYRKLIPITKEITKAHYDRFIRFPAWQVLTSASHNQEALEFLNNRDIETNQDHSPFAAGLIEALQQGEGDINSDGVIIATELYQYLRDYVEKDSKDRQTPGFFPLKKHDRGEYLFKLPDTPLNLRETPKLNKNNNPYRGLEPFEAKHSKLFFGRDEVIEKLSKKVSQGDNQLTIVTGISGSGKSSLVKAGLIPYLQNQKHNKWLIFVPIRPGTNPYSTLARALAQLNGNLFKRTGDTTLFGKQLQNNSHKLISAIQTWSQQNSTSRILLVIDQFEELITMAQKDKPTNTTVNQSWWQKLTGKLDQTKAEAESDLTEEETEKWTEFIKLLVEILDQCPQLSLIVTLRSDFEPRFQESAFKSNWANARFVVRPMRSDELREAVEKPAAEKALYFEPPELVNRLVDEVSQMPGALPLLSFTLSEMYIQLYEAWRDQGKSDRSLTVTEDFEQKGGVAGALTRRANEEFKQLPSPKKAHRLTMKRVMLRMVELEGGEAVRRRVLKSELTYPSEEENERVETVLDKLQQARLIVTGTDAEADEPYYEPAHDYLVRGWERLQVWITKEQDNLALQDLLTHAAKAWNKENTDLWDTNSRLDRLKEIQDQNISNNNWLNEVESEFIKKSVARKKFRQRRTASIFITAISILSLLSIAATSFALQSRKREKMQFARQLATTSEWIRNQKSSLHETSVLIALEAYKLAQKIGEPSSNIDSALRNGLNSLPINSTSIFFEDRISDIQFGSSGSHLIIGSLGGVIKSFQVNTGKETKLISDGHLLTDLELSPKKDYLAVSTKNRDVKLIEISSGQQTAVISEEYLNTDIKFSPNGKYLITSSGGSGGVNVVLVEVRTGKRIATITHESWIRNILFSPTSDYLITVASNNAKLIEVSTGKEVTTISHQDDIENIKFSPNGKYIVTESLDLTAKLIQANTGEQLFTTPKSHWSNFEFSPNEEYLLIQNIDGVVNLFEIDTGKNNDIFLTKDIVVFAKFSTNSKFLAVGDRGNSIKLLNVDKVELINIIHHKNTIVNINFSPDGRHLATSTVNGDAKLIQVFTGKEITKTSISLTSETVDTQIKFSQSGKYLLISSKDSSKAKLVEVTSGKKIIDISHRDFIEDIEFSFDENYLATASRDGTTKLVQVSTGQEITVIFHQDWINNVEFSSNGNYLATSSNDGTAKLVDINTRKETALISHNSGINNLMFSPNGNYLATGSYDGTAKLTQIDSVEINSVIVHNSNVRGKRFSPKWNYVAVGSNTNNSNDRFVTLFNLKTGTENIIIKHKNAINDIKFSSSEKYLATASKDGTVKLVEIDTSKEISVISHKSYFGNVKVYFSPGEKYLAIVYGSGNVKLTEVNTGNEIAYIPSKNIGNSLQNIKFSPDGKYLVTGSYDGKVNLIEVAAGKQVANFYHEYDVSEIKFSVDGKYFATASNDGTIKLIEVDTGKEVSVVTHQSNITKIEFSSDSNYIATASKDGTAKLVEVDTGKEVAIVSHNDELDSLEFDSNNKYLATGSWDGTVKLTRLRTRKEIAVIYFAGRVNNLKFSPDGKYLVAADNSIRKDETVNLFEIRTHKKSTFISQSYITNIKFSPNSNYLAIGSRDGTAKLVQIKKGKQVAVFFHEDMIKNIEFSLDNNYLATVSDDGTAKLIQTKKGKEVAVISHKANLDEIKFSQNSKYLISSSSDSIRLDLINPQELVDKTCARLSQNLSISSWQKYIGNEKYTKTCEQIPIHNSFFQEGKKLALLGEIDRAAMIFQRAQKIKTDIDLKNSETKKLLIQDPEKLANKYYASTKLEEGQNLLKLKKFAEATSIFKEALKLDPEIKINTELWNYLCWSGSLNRQAKKVIFACEKAVYELSSEVDLNTQAMNRDSRGLALVLTGKYNEAIHDFQFYVEHSQADEESIARRKTWIEALKKGNNPFTNKVLEELKNE